nr:hypothetical protein [uncultured Actinoplanes sp.]
MTDGRRLQAGHWLLIGIVVLLIAVGVAIVVRRGDADPVVSGPTQAPSPAAAASPAPRPDCSPQITGTWVDAAKAKYGFVYRSRCDQVVRRLQFRVAALGPDGDEVSTADDIASGGVLFPGGELATAGDLQVAEDQKLSGLKVQVIDFAAYAPRDFSGWAKPEAVDLHRGRPDSLGAFEITADVRAEPPAAPVCVNEIVLVLRDAAGKIVYADADPAVGVTRLKPSFQVPPIAGLDFTRTEIYLPQTPRTERPPTDGVSCDGR